MKIILEDRTQIWTTVIWGWFMVQKCSMCSQCRVDVVEWIDSLPLVIKKKAKNNQKTTTTTTTTTKQMMPSSFLSFCTVNLVSNKVSFFCIIFLDCGPSCEAESNEEFGNSFRCQNIPEEISLEEVIKCTPLFINRM